MTSRDDAHDLDAIATDELERPLYRFLPLPN